MRPFALITLVVFTGCTQFPELDALETPAVADAPYPRLLPIDQLLTGPAPRADESDIAELQARAAALLAEADRLAAQDATGADAQRVAQLRQRAAAISEQVRRLGGDAPDADAERIQRLRQRAEDLRQTQ